MTDGTEKATKSRNISHRDVSCVRRCVCLWLASWWCSCQFDSAIRQLKSVYRFTVYRRGQHEYIHWPWDSCGFVLFFHSYGAATACMSQMKSINTTFPFVWLELCFISHRFFFSFMALAIPLVWKLKTEFCVQSHATNVRLAYSIWAVVAASFDFIRIRKTNNHILLVLKIIIHLWIRRPHARTMSEAIRRMVNMNNVLHSSFIDCCCSLIFRQR